MVVDILPAGQMDGVLSPSLADVECSKSNTILPGSLLGHCP
jgi:hypothetical protein